MLRELCWRFPFQFISLLILMVVQGVLNGVTIISIGPITDLLLAKPNLEFNNVTKIFENVAQSLDIEFTLANVFIFFGLVMICNGIAAVVINYATLRIKFNVLVDLLTGVMGTFFRARYQFFSQGKVGTLLNSFQYEVQKIGDSFGTFARGLATIFQVIVFLGVPFFINSSLTLIFLFSAILFTGPLWFLRRYTYKYGKRQTRYGNDVGTVLEENLSSAKIIKSHGLGTQAVKRYKETVQKITKQSIILGTITRGVQSMFVPLGTLAALIALYISHLQGVSISDTAVVLFSFFRAVPMLGSLVQSKAALESLVPAYEQIQHLEKEAKALEEPKEGLPYKGIGEGIKFENVSFSYEDGRKAIDNAKFEFEKGKMVALVGPSGAGKTTVVDLLLGLYERDSGTITLNGMELEHYNLDSFRERIGYVPQEPKLFHATIRENLLWSSSCSANEEMWAACKTANADIFIKDMPAGLDTVVGDNGVRLSGGQRQRLALARALIRKPDLLILDEATSSLDTESERLIQLSIDALAGHKEMVIIVIAHRLSTIKSANYIYILKGGVVIESGAYDELLREKDGTFRKMIADQGGILVQEVAGVESNLSIKQP